MYRIRHPSRLGRKVGCCIMSTSADLSRRNSSHPLTSFNTPMFKVRYKSTSTENISPAPTATTVGGTTLPEPSVTASGMELPQIIQTKGIPIHLYAEEIEKEALDQVIVLAESPIPVDYVAVMADAHSGKGVTVGTVFASEHYVSPNAVGVDIGCGMAAIPIDRLFKNDLSGAQKSKIQQLIKERIPTGFTQHKHTLVGTETILDEITSTVKPTDYLKKQLLLPRVTDQLGTLGGGNHFIEVVYCDKSEQVWCMLHSGSRNIGNRVATHYDDVARNLLNKQGVNTIRLNGMNYMEIDSQEGQDYLRDMEWCQRYAYHNRKVMKELLLQIMYEVMKKDADIDNSVNIHHNYCKCEDCGDGRKLYVTRKGATSAAKGEMGIIPGSMGTGSYITRGRGNMMSWRSSSHGAGRRMSRTKAHSRITQQDFERVMSGIVCDTHPSVKDEAPQAYKDLAIVMKQQESLTDIVHRLLPLINVKGFEEKLPKKYRKSNKKK
jgi:tRNA-splicing ligase RtcB (3'-phosphate/5'-hydroxy nucleic acid ligase)